MPKHDPHKPEQKRAWRWLTLYITIAMLPCACILSLVYNQIQKSWSDWQAIQDVKVKCQLVTGASHLSRELQLERGLTAILAGSPDDSATQNALSRQYAQTDTVKTSEFLPALNASKIDPQSSQAVIDALGKLNEIRSNSRSDGEHYDQVFPRYTELTGRVLQCSLDCTKTKSHGGIGNIFDKIVLDQTARESLGQIRGTMAVAAHGNTDLGERERNNLIKHYERVIGIMDSPISQIGGGIIGKDFLSSEPWQQLETFIQRTLTNESHGQVPHATAQTQFGAATQVIELIYQSELDELTTLDSQLSTLQKTNTRDIWASIIWGSAGLISTMIVLATACFYENARRRINQSKQIECDLTRDLEYQKRTLDSHAIVSIADVRGNIIYANEKFCQLSGYSLEELIGQNHRLVRSDEHDREFYRDLWKTISRGDTWHGEIKNRAKDGTHYWVDATIVPFKDNNGKITKYVAIRSDITAQKTAEDHVRQQATRLQAATQGARLGIWEYDITNDRLLWDGMMHELYGTGQTVQGETEYPYQNWRDAVDPADLVETEKIVDNALKSESFFNTQFKITRSDNGQTRHIRSRATITRDNQGRATHMIGINWDVTDYVLTSEQIESREVEIRAILDAIPSYVFYKDANNMILRLNSAAAESIGLPADQIENRPTEDFFQAEDAEAYLQDDLTVFRSQKPKLNIIEPYRTSDNEERIIRTDKIPIKNERGEYDRLVAIATDITALKRTENDLRVTANRATLLHRVGEISNETSVFEEAIQRVLDLTCETLGWQIGHCYLRSPDLPDRLIPADLWHMKKTPQNDRFREITDQTEFVAGVGLPGQVLESGQVTMIEDVSQDDNYLKNRKVTGLHIHGAVALPVVVDERTEAVLEFYSERSLDKNSPMIETLEAVGRQLGIMLETYRASESALKSKQRLDLALAAANQGLWDWNIKDNSIYFNDTWLTMLGYEPRELPMTVETWKELCHPDDLLHAMKEIERYIAGETDIYRCELRAKRKDGSWKWLLDTGKVTEYDTDGSPLRMVGVHIEIDHIKDNEQRIKESERRYKLAVNGSRDGIWDWNLLEDKVYYAPQWKRMLGLKASDPVSDSPDEWTSRIDPRDIGAFMQEFNQHLSGEDDIFEVEMRMIHAKGQTVWVLCRGAVVRDDSGRAIRVAGSLADITAIKDAQDKLRKAAEHDRLTDLPNRELFVKRLKKSIQKAKDDPNYKFAVLFFDFDRFKIINDSLGHNVGDALLVDIAKQFREVLRHSDTAARFGGDEFVVLLNDLESYDEAKLASDRLLNTFAKPHQLSGHEVISTASIGMVTNEQQYETAEEMIRDADAAMYQAKAAGRAQAIIFDQAMHEKALNQLNLESDLRTALDNNQFYLVYQPIVDLATKELHGFEALLRWNHPTRGNISPAEFIPITEDTGLIVPIGEWVLREASRQLQQWNRTIRIDRPITVNVNLSMRQVCHPGIIETIRSVIEETGINPSHLKLEVTESTIVDDRHDMVPILNQIREMGILLAMDDFGTGHSSLGNLHMLPVDILKIDQSFIKSMSDNRALAAVMQAIITLAQHLGMVTVAEGIETTDQLALLQSLDCQFGQGFYFQRPMPTEDATRYLLGIDDNSASA